jgi:deoxyribonuclease-4
LSYVDSVGAGAVQIYVGNSRGWARPAGDPAWDQEFAAGCAQRSIPAFIHASLLVNLGSPTPGTVEQSVQTLAHALIRAHQIGAEGVVFHAGRRSIRLITRWR